MLVFIFITLICNFGAIMAGIYIHKYRKLPITVWKPEVAWIRASIYFSFCNIIIGVSGTLKQLLIRPFFTLEQISNVFWVIHAILCFVYVVFAYVFLWPRSTLTFDRKYYLGPEIAFGIIWGFSTGGFFLSLYHLWSLTGVPLWANFILGYVSCGIWQYFIQAYFWDIYVSPEHDTPKSIRIKTVACHIPNMLISMGFLAIWGNYTIFIIIFIIALTSTTIAQKFPAPWAK
jgi:hypothetical protein